MEYFRLARAAMNAEDGGIFLLDMLGGHAAESVVKLHRQNEISGRYWVATFAAAELLTSVLKHFSDFACASGLSYLWEQARYDPVKRQLTCHISLKDPQSRQVCNAVGRIPPVALKHSMCLHDL